MNTTTKKTNDAHEPPSLWIDDPLILVKKWKTLNPIDEQTSPTEKFNASARLIILASGLASLLTRKYKYLGIGSIALMGLYWLTRNKRRNYHPNMIVGSSSLSLPPSVLMGNSNRKRRQTSYHHDILNRGFNPHAVVNDPIGNPDIYQHGVRDPFHPNIHDKIQYEGIDNPYDPIWIIGRQAPTSVTPVPYDPLGNEQTFFGFDSGLTDPAFSQNKYNSELEDRMMHYPRIEYKNQQQSSSSPNNNNAFGFQPNRQDPRSEFFDGVVPRYDAHLMQMEPYESNYGTSSEYETERIAQHHKQLNPIYQPSEDRTRMTMPFNKIDKKSYEPLPFGHEDNPLINENNPYGNPNPYQFHEGIRLKRTRQPNENDVHDMITEQAQRDVIKMYYGAGELDEGLFINSLPDPSGFARPVFFPESSEWDKHIVSGNARNQYLW